MEGRVLWIVRHGKAAVDPPAGGGDRERELTERGRRDASALGGLLVDPATSFALDGAVRPELVLCSAAVRTRQTADLLVEGLGGSTPLEAYRTLYEADTDLALRYATEVDDASVTVALVGHNPTVHQLAWELCADDGQSGREVLQERGFPTCAAAALEVPVGSWTELTAGGARLLGLFTPPYA